MSEETRRIGISSTLEKYATEYNKRISQSGTTLEDLDNIAQKCFELLMPLQWTDGPPKDTGEGRFVVVIRPNGGKGHYCYEELWDATIDRLTDHSDNNLPVIKHMRLPDYE